MKRIKFIGILIILFSCKKQECKFSWKEYNSNAPCFEYFNIVQKRDCNYDLRFYFGEKTGVKDGGDAPLPFEINGTLKFSSDKVELIQDDQRIPFFEYNQTNPINLKVLCLKGNIKVILNYTCILQDRISYNADSIYKFKFKDINISKHMQNLHFFVSKENGIVGIYSSVYNPYYKVDEVIFYKGNIFEDKKNILNAITK